jgi:uncharacterized protein
VTRLHGQTSPYLLDHLDNPVDWFPWGQDAFEEARRRDVPVMVSIGYYTCHWCHVMARESFSDPDVGELVNELMVSIKVDREELPDVDSHFMTAAGAFTSQLGWPLTVFTTPDGHPFYAATYLPPASRGGIPSFVEVIRAVSEAWTSRRSEVESSATALGQSIREALGTPTERGEAMDWEAVVGSLLASEDQHHGGFTGANKFPMAPVLRFLLEYGPSTSARELARRTLSVMATSELRDGIEGGFFRYATRPDWTIPHYERMLTDNAQLLWCYSAAGDLPTAEGIVQFLMEVMAQPTGFASAQHSESVLGGQMVEGGYYALDAEARARVTPPDLDRKVVTGWVGLALSGLARAELAGVPGQPGERGREVARALLKAHRPGPGILSRVSVGGVASPAPATLEDYGGLALGLLELGLATADVELCREARLLVEECVVAGDGVRYRSASAPDPIVERLSGGHRELSEGATPSGEALIARAGVILSALAADHRYLDAARTTLEPGQAMVSRHPLSAGGLAGALWAAGDVYCLLVVDDDLVTSPLAQMARSVVEGRVVVCCVTREQAKAFAQAGFTLFDGKEAVSGMAYLCRGTICDRPDTSSEELRGHLLGLGLVSREDT